MRFARTVSVWGLPMVVLAGLCSCEQAPADSLPSYADGSDLRGTREVVNPDIQSRVVSVLTSDAEHQTLVNYMVASHSFDVASAKYIAASDTEGRPYVGLSYRHSPTDSQQVEAVLVSLMSGDTANPKRYRYIEECDPASFLTIVFVDGGTVKSMRFK